MYDKKFKELVKIAVEKLKDEFVLKLLQADVSSGELFGAVFVSLFG